MKYVILTIEWCINRGLVIPSTARQSVDGTKVILHYDFINPVIKSTDHLRIYDHDSVELNNLLSSKEWNSTLV